MAAGSEAPANASAAPAVSEADILTFVKRKAVADLLRLSVPFASSSLSASVATTLAELRKHTSLESINREGESSELNFSSS